MSSIKTISGDYFPLTAPETYQFKIGDIAHSLSMICRYTGHCLYHYSVAQHSLLVSYMVPAHLAMEALLHDAAEAYLGDVASPLKSLLPEYKVIEKRVERAICRQMHLGYPLHNAVHLADKRALDIERSILTKKGPMDDEQWPYPAEVPSSGSIMGDWIVHAELKQEHARSLFLARWRELR